MSNLLRSVLDGINSIVMNHGWSIVIFTVLIRLALMPLDIKSRKSMRKMSLINPEMQKLQKKSSFRKSQKILKWKNLTQKIQKKFSKKNLKLKNNILESPHDAGSLYFIKYNV